MVTLAARMRLNLCFAAGAAFLAASCGSSPPRAPNASRPVTESRAIALIAKAMREAGDTPKTGRNIQLSSGRWLALDVGSEGHKYGVAYMTEQDKGALDAQVDLPPRSGSLLPIVQGGGDEAGTIGLVLFAEDYRFDDEVGAAHEKTAITAENQLQRDVRDFIVLARGKKLP